MAAPTRPKRQEQEPASADITEVAPSVLRLQLRISMPGLGHVNCYLLEDERGVALVDPGMPGPQSWRALVGRLKQAGVKVRDVHTVIVTHSHPDHFGGAGRLRHDAGAEVVSHRSFRTWFDPDDDGDDPEAEPAGSPWSRLAPWGGGPAHKPPVSRRLLWGPLLRPLMRRWMRTPAPSRRLEDADVIRLAGREWVAVHTPGHTPDHLCLFDPAEGVLLSGDHVLPTITPHISGLTPGADPLQSFFDSLDRMHTLDGARMVLPAHGHPFTDLSNRVDAIKAHHAERLDRLRTASIDLGRPATVPELSTFLFSPRAQGPMADSETFAHLEHLRRLGQATRLEDGPEFHYVID
jgi:glyoxylase-like metal-dependent hydrolase (beta-lactamase superfamily II)